ncbi:polysaccharide pyruvyl transferase family protein [Marinobacter lipolyticus]|uniref:polysaccharide pyruvyl transferase family protein n=1 Tax=Marinobacter lipolyticus TaxID=209639 RepID=UPI003A93292F
MKKVGLLTLPLKDNYGGILQAAALFGIIERLGCEVTLIRKEFYYPPWKRLVIRVLEKLPFQNFKKFRSSRKNSLVHNRFLDQVIPRKTKPVISKEELRSIAREYKLDSVVVGSDQVWRLEYIDKVYYGAYFLNFLDGMGIKKISYAASFGVNYWQAPELSSQVSSWLSDFNAVSVRESTGQALCAQFGRQDAVHVLDPTLLIGPDFYLGLIQNLGSRNRGLLYYVLDQSDFSETLLQDIHSALGFGVEITRIFSKGQTFQSHTVPEWVMAFADAEFVLTDSFHGMVFSVMFNKPFLAIANTERGASRFESFLDRLGLKERLIIDCDSAPVETLLYDLIDYDAVNARIAQWRDESEAFLKSALDVV